MTNSVSVRVGAPGAKQASSDVDNLRDRFAKLQQQGAKGFAIGAGAAITAKGLNLVSNAIGDIGDAISGSIHAYQEQEVASGRLTQSLLANVKGWNGNTDAIKAATEAGIKLGFTDTDTTNSMAILIGATHDQAKALRILAVAQDLARFKGLSLVEASTALTTIEAGRARGLAQLGINVKDYSTTEERLAAVEKLAGGQAQQFAESDMGKVQVEVAKADQAQEKFGKGLSKLETVILPAVGDAIGGLGDAIGTLTDSFDSAIPRSEKLREEADALRNGWINAGPGAKQMADALDAEAAAMDSAATATSLATRNGDDWTASMGVGAEATANNAAALAGLAAAFGAAGLAATNASQGTRDYNAWLGKLKYSITDLEPSISTVDGMLEGLFAGTKFKGQKAGLFDQLHGLQDQLKQTKDKGDAEKIAGQIADIRTKIIELNIESVAQTGDKAALTRMLKGYEKEFKNTDQGAFTLIQRLEQLYGLPMKYPVGVTVREIGGAGGAGKVIGAFAEGGIVKAKPGGSIVKVAEAGHDEAIVPLSGPYAPKVDPFPSGMTGSGASVTLNVSVNLPNAFGMTPGDGEKVGRAIGPYIAKYLQSRGLLAAARAF